MSLNILLSKQRGPCKRYRDKMKELIPKSKDFKTHSGAKAFSKEFVLKASYEKEYSSYAMLVGTAFDYLSKFIVGQIISNNKEMSYSNLFAEKTILNMRCWVTEDTYTELVDKFYIGMELVRSFVHSNSEITDELIEYALYLSKVDHLYPIKDSSADRGAILLRELPDALKIDLFNLCNTFIESKLVNQNSDVIFSPNFLDIMPTLGGAEGDIYIDGTLWDFKTNKSHGYKGRDIMQITSYYIFNQICEEINGTKSNLKSHKIDKIGIYMARYGEATYADVKDLDMYKIEDMKLYIKENVIIHYKNYKANFSD